MPEKFRERELTSFTKPQMERILLWGFRNGMSQYGKELGFSEAAKRAIDEASLDEKGKPITDKGRERLALAYKSFTPLMSFGDLESLKTMHVWLIAEEPPKLLFKWKQQGDSLERWASETRFYGKF